MLDSKQLKYFYIAQILQTYGTHEFINTQFKYSICFHTFKSNQVMDEIEQDLTGLRPAFIASQVRSLIIKNTKT